MTRRRFFPGMMIVLLIVSLTAGCLGCGPGSNILGGAPTKVPTNITVPEVAEPYTAVPRDTVTPTAAPAVQSPSVTRTETGYLIRCSEGSEGPVEVELDAGKVAFNIKLTDYHVGDRYFLRLNSVGESFNYQSTHEFTGDSGAGNLRITRTIPMPGTYQLNVDYPGGWELEITR